MHLRFPEIHILKKKKKKKKKVLPPCDHQKSYISVDLDEKGPEIKIVHI